MQESYTIRCPKCGGVMDAFLEIAGVEFNTDIGGEARVLVKWEDSLIEHECREVKA